MTALTVEVTAVRPAGGGYPWPTLVGVVMHGPTAGDVVILAADAAEAEVIAADLAELGAMPPVVVAEPWQVVAEPWQPAPTCTGCGAAAMARLVGPDGVMVAAWCHRARCRADGYADARMVHGTAAYCMEVTA